LVGSCRGANETGTSKLRLAAEPAMSRTYGRGTLPPLWYAQALGLCRQGTGRLLGVGTQLIQRGPARDENQTGNVGRRRKRLSTSGGALSHSSCGCGCVTNGEPTPFFRGNGYHEDWTVVRRIEVMAWSLQGVCLPKTLGPEGIIDPTAWRCA